MNFFSFKKQPTLALVFDIRDSSISLAVVKFQKSEKPELVLCQNFSISVQDPQDQQKYIVALFATIDAAILSMRKTLARIGIREKIERTYFFLGSPWSIGQSKLIKVTKDRSFEVNNIILEKIITSEESEVEKTIQSDMFESGWQVLDEKVIQSKLNGYVVENIFGKKTTDLEIELFVSFVPTEVKNKLSAFIDTAWGKRARKHAYSHTLASSVFVKDAYPQTDSLIYADIGDFITDIYIMRDGVISAIASIPIGENDILQSMVTRTKISEYAVASAITIHRDGNFDPASRKDFEKNIGSGILVWSKKVAEIL
jgi:hypothetical protein